MGVLGPADPAPFVVFNRQGRAPFLLVGDHAGNAIPTVLGDLGLPPRERTRHIALDIGVRGLGEALAVRLDAVFVHQHYSRLVVDCNRDPGSPQAIVRTSDGTEIAGNLTLSNTDAADRVRAIHAAYHDAIGQEIARRATAPILVSLHSFTPVMNGVARPWHVGVLYDGGDTTIARALLAAFGRRADLVVGDNEPYRMDTTDYTVPHHAYGAGLAYVEIEIRQDLLATAEGQERWAEVLEEVLTA